jgi:DNA-binding transcriptional MocR family regulator
MPVNSFDNYHMSWKPRRDRLTAPIYLSLAAMLEEDILSGLIPRGTRLPPQRELADWLDIDFTTVTRAFNVCREKNLIYGITGRGTFVSPVPGSASPAINEDADIIDLGTVASFPSLSSGIVTAMRSVIESGHVERLFSYAGPGGAPHHIAAGRRMLEFGNIAAPANGIAVFAGAQNAISVALLSLFTAGDAIAVDPYTYSNLIESARLAHVKLVPVEGDGGGMNPGELDRLAKKYRIKGLFTMPAAANPTGITLSEERKDAIACVARARSLTIIEDDISPFAPSPQRRPFFMRNPDSTIYIAAYMSMLAPALRITYAAFPEAYRDKLLKGLFLLNMKAGSIDAEIISELVLSGEAARIMAAKRKAAIGANAVFDRTFPELSLSRRTKAEGLFPFFRSVPLAASRLSGPEAEDFFRARGVATLHSCRFAVGKARQHDFLRISLSSANSERQLAEGLRRLKKGIKELESGKSVRRKAP